MNNDSSTNKYYTIKTYAKVLKLSPNTIYRNPLKYYMFKVGGSWRANDNSLKMFEQQTMNDNNVFRLALISGKENKQCLSTREVKFTGSTFQRQMEKELGDLLAPRTK